MSTEEKMQRKADKIAVRINKIERDIRFFIEVAQEKGDQMGESYAKDMLKDAVAFHKKLYYGCRMAGLNEGGK